MEALKTVCGIHNNNLITDAKTIKKVDKIINDIGKTYSDIELCLNRYTDIPYKDSDEYYKSDNLDFFPNGKPIEGFAYPENETQRIARMESEKDKSDTDYKTLIEPKKSENKQFLDWNFKSKAQSHFSKGFLEGFRVSLLIQKVLYKLLNGEISDKKLVVDDDNKDDYIWDWDDIKFMYNPTQNPDNIKYFFYSQTDKNKLLDKFIKYAKNGQFWRIEIPPFTYYDTQYDSEFENNESLMFDNGYHR